MEHGQKSSSPLLAIDNSFELQPMSYIKISMDFIRLPSDLRELSHPRMQLPDLLFRHGVPLEAFQYIHNVMEETMQELWLKLKPYRSKIRTARWLILPLFLCWCSCMYEAWFVVNDYSHYHDSYYYDVGYDRGSFIAVLTLVLTVVLGFTFAVVLPMYIYWLELRQRDEALRLIVDAYGAITDVAEQQNNVFRDYGIRLEAFYARESVANPKHRLFCKVTGKSKMGLRFIELDEATSSIP